MTAATATDVAAPWAAIADLAEHELTLARDGRWEELATCSHERVRRAVLLPATPPRQAAGDLRRLAACQEALLAVLTSARALTARELGALRRSRGAAHGYAATAAAPAVGAIEHRG
jgi:hypothetical protein